MEINNIFSQKVGLVIEFLLIFIALPLLNFFHIIPLHQILLLLLATIYTALIIYINYNPKKIIRWPSKSAISKEVVNSTLLRFVFASLFILGYTLLFESAYFLDMPRNHTTQWILIILTYPIFSALPQEWIFRKFLLNRYSMLFRNQYEKIIVSVVAFTFIHIVYGSWVTIAFSFVGGVIFTHTYIRTRSLWFTALEHSLYGIILFTSGLGHYFFEGFVV